MDVEPKFGVPNAGVEEAPNAGAAEGVCVAPNKPVAATKQRSSSLCAKGICAAEWPGTKWVTGCIVCLTKCRLLGSKWTRLLLTKWSA